MKTAWQILAFAVSLQLFCTAGHAAEHNTLSQEEIDHGWLLLFDGETLFGWAPASKADWSVADGVISVSSGEKGLLNTTSQFGDFVFKAEFRSPPETNSGIFLRTVPQPMNPAADCYELNIAGKAISPFPTGSFVARQKAAGEHESTGWQTFEVTAHGGEFTVKLDDQVVLSYTDPRPLRRGCIGLQFNSGKVEFRNIKLKPLGLASIFNGKDLAGWKSYPDMKSVFSVTPEGVLNVKNGKGQLETEDRYADFVLQLEVISNGKGLNSGIFFRSIPGETMQGYECQINNGFKEGDRTQPLDHGTGGIQWRQAARKVVANDFEWFHLTLTAAGDHMAAWVNGYAVSDFTDTRPADPNPRKGLRREAGTLILQGHDPTTDLSFRNIEAAELPAR